MKNKVGEKMKKVTKYFTFIALVLLLSGWTNKQYDMQNTVLIKQNEEVQDDAIEDHLVTKLSKTTTNNTGLNNQAKGKIEFCVDTAPIWRFLGYIFMLIKIVIPLVIIILGVVDLFKVITSNDEKAINKAMASVIQRLIAGIAIFFVPTVISLLFSLVKESAPFLESADACQTCLLRPTASGKDSCKNYVDLSKSSRQGVR